MERNTFQLFQSKNMLLKEPTSFVKEKQPMLHTNTVCPRMYNNLSHAKNSGAKPTEQGQGTS